VPLKKYQIAGKDLDWQRADRFSFAPKTEVSGRDLAAVKIALAIWAVVVAIGGADAGSIGECDTRVTVNKGRCVVENAPAGTISSGKIKCVRATLLAQLQKAQELSQRVNRLIYVHLEHSKIRSGGISGGHMDPHKSRKK